MTNKLDIEKVVSIIAERNTLKRQNKRLKEENEFLHKTIDEIRETVNKCNDCVDSSAFWSLFGKDLRPKGGES